MSQRAKVPTNLPPQLLTALSVEYLDTSGGPSGGSEDGARPERGFGACGEATVGWGLDRRPAPLTCCLVCLVGERGVRFVLHRLLHLHGRNTNEFAEGFYLGPADIARDYSTETELMLLLLLLLWLLGP